MKELTIEEVKLLNEMKDRCLAKGQYVDKKAKDKFKMLCHLEDFAIQYYELQQRIDEVMDNISHELYGHILQGDEVSWNEEFYTEGKLDYRKLLIYLLENDVLKTLKGSDK